MSNDRHYSFAVIGGGPAGYTAALKLAEFNPDAKICLIEKALEKIGGTCLNEGCIPVKSLAESAELYRKICNSKEYGLYPIIQTPDITKIAETGMKNQDQLRQGILSLLKNKKVQILDGTASFRTSTVIRIQNGGEDYDISADKTVIASGSVPKSMPVFPVNGKNVVTSTEMLKLQAIPKKLLVIGGGAIGCEFASIFRQLGSDVTVVEMLERLLPSEDADISRALEREFQKSGIRVLAGAKVKSLENSPVHTTVKIETSEKEEISGQYDIVLVAAGRTPNTAGLGLDKAGVQSNQGFIPVDPGMRTNVANIFAAGDVVNTPAYAHTAAREGTIAAENASGKPLTPVRYPNIPRIVFTDPQVGAAGMTENTAVREGLEIRIHKKFFKAIGKAVVMKNTAGFVKILSEEKTGKILGASIIGPSATELIHELALAVEMELTIKEVGELVHGHPTLSELTGETCG